MSGEVASVMALAARLWEQGRQAEAIEAFAALQARRPEDADIAMRLGLALMQRGQLVEAVAAMEPAAAVAPETHPLHDCLSRALGGVHWRERGPEAIPALRARLASAPEDHDRHGALATALLSCGRLAEAWPHYAWRWHGMKIAARAPEHPLVRPDPAAWAGKRVLLFAEQGLGDMLQFLRYVPMAVRHAREVVVEVYPPLLRLARTLPGAPCVVAEGEAVPPWDEAVPMMHLPWAFGTDLATVPATVPYFTPDPVAVEGWRRRLAGLPGRKVGLVWSGDPRPHDRLAHRIDRRRSLKLAQLAPLGAVAGISLVSLQKGAGAAQPVPAGMVLHDWTAELGDFADTAALMQALDLVISADTSPLHLAGALGRPVWLLDRYDSCWRWMRERDDSPWYPTLRRFRQGAPGDWGGVVARVVGALKEESAFFL